MIYESSPMTLHSYQIRCFCDRRRVGWIGFATSALLCVMSLAEPAVAAEPGLIGHWKLQGDCRDYSGNENNGVNHGVDLENGKFDGIQSFIEVPASDSLKLGKGDFSVATWIHTEKELDDIVG